MCFRILLMDAWNVPRTNEKHYVPGSKRKKFVKCANMSALLLNMMARMMGNLKSQLSLFLPLIALPSLNRLSDGCFYPHSSCMVWLYIVFVYSFGGRCKIICSCFMSHHIVVSHYCFDKAPSTGCSEYILFLLQCMQIRWSISCLESSVLKLKACGAENLQDQN